MRGGQQSDRFLFSFGMKAKFGSRGALFRLFPFILAKHSNEYLSDARSAAESHCRMLREQQTLAAKTKSTNTDRFELWKFGC